jgi:hypothetical protein
MFSFGPITRIPPSGSPLFMRNVYTALAESGTYNLFGADADLERRRALAANSGTYLFDASGGHISQHLKLDPDGGIYNLLGGDARIYLSVFNYGDPEIIRVPVEVTSMKILAEPRDMYVTKTPDPNVFEEPREETTPPRLRRG